MNAERASELLDDLRAATARLASSIHGLAPTDLRAPSLLPGWNRSHLLTHLARNADGARNLLLSVRSGQSVRMYASSETRAADIASGADRPGQVILDDAVESSGRLILDADCMAPDLWSRQILVGSGSADAHHIEAIRPLEMRIREVEIHHVDLAAGYSFRDTPETLLGWLLTDTISRLARADFHVAEVSGKTDAWIVGNATEGIHVRGQVHDLIAWLTGRSGGAALASEEPLPTPPSLG